MREKTLPSSLKLLRARRVSGIFFLCCFCINFFAVDSDLLVLEDQVARHPSDPTALYNLGVTAFKAGDYKKAGACFSTLKPLCTNKKISQEQAVQIFYNAGNTEFQLKDYQSALASFESVLTYDPGHQKAREKRDYIKQLLEKQKQEQQQKQDQKDQDQKDTQEQDQNKQDQKKQDQQNQDQKDQQQRESEQQKGQDSNREQLPVKQQELLALADKLDKQAQEQLVRHQVGMRARGGGQHEW